MQEPISTDGSIARGITNLRCLPEWLGFVDASEESDPLLKTTSLGLDCAEHV